LLKLAKLKTFDNPVEGDTTKSLESIVNQILLLYIVPKIHHHNLSKMVTVGINSMKIEFNEKYITVDQVNDDEQPGFHIVQNSDEINRWFHNDCLYSLQDTINT